MERVSAEALKWALSKGELVRVLPGVYTADRNDSSLLQAAAMYAAPAGALSHTTALWCWHLLTPLPRPLHVTVPASRQPYGSALIRAHRRYGPLSSVTRMGLDVVSLESALLNSWPLLKCDDRRRVLIDAVRTRRTTVERLRAGCDALPKLRDRPELRQLIDLLDAGCQSELELFGHTRVFRHPSMPELQAQYPIRLRQKTIYADLADPELRVAIELDGAQFHDTPAARERDRRRDVELAALGWVVLRFSARRLREDPAGVRREVLEVLAARRAQLLAS